MRGDLRAKLVIERPGIADLQAMGEVALGW
jgi:hypothetical protein